MPSILFPVETKIFFFQVQQCLQFPEMLNQYIEADIECELHFNKLCIPTIIAVFMIPLRDVNTEFGKNNNQGFSLFDI